MSRVLCMIAEYHLACAIRGSMTTSPILPKAIEQYLPPLADYVCLDSPGLTDVRVHDHKARSLCVGVWLHQMNMTLSWEKEASESLVQLRHSKGLLLSYLLAPGTGNLHFEEVLTQQEPPSVRQALRRARRTVQEVGSSQGQESLERDRQKDGCNLNCPRES